MISKTLEHNDNINENIQYKLELEKKFSYFLQKTSFYVKLKDFCKYINQYGKIRLVGGCVRDFILGKIPTDIDLSTDLKPEEIMKLAKKYGVKTIPTGLSHGTVTVILEQNLAIEITTLRYDLECDGRKATVEFTTNFYEDAKRRDFTINAMSFCILNEELFDYFDGIKHLKEKQVIFIGDAKTRIIEDYLRILRFFRFSSYYAESIHESSYQACLELSINLNKISQERITSEINKIFCNTKKLKYTLCYLQNIFSHINFPAIKDPYNILDYIDNFTNLYIENINKIITLYKCQKTNKEQLIITNQSNKDNTTKEQLREDISNNNKQLNKDNWNSNNSFNANWNSNNSFDANSKILTQGSSQNLLKFNIASSANLIYAILFDDINFCKNLKLSNLNFDIIKNLKKIFELIYNVYINNAINKTIEHKVILSSSDSIFAQDFKNVKRILYTMAIDAKSSKEILSTLVDEKTSKALNVNYHKQLTLRNSIAVFIYKLILCKNINIEIICNIIAIFYTFNLIDKDIIFDIALPIDGFFIKETLNISGNKIKETLDLTQEIYILSNFNIVKDDLVAQILLHTKENI